MTLSTVDVWEGFSGRLREFIRRRLPANDDPDDVLQDVFLKVHASVDSVRDQDRLAAWLYRLTKNTLIDHYRKRRDEGLDFDVPAIEYDDDEERHAERLIASYVGELVDALPVKYRKALILTEFEGLTQREAAERLGLSVSGAKSRVQRGKALLRQQMLECCHFEFDRRGRVIDYRAREACCTNDETSFNSRS